MSGKESENSGMQEHPTGDTPGANGPDNGGPGNGTGSGLPLPAKAMVESLLFVADTAVDIDRITSTLEIAPEQVEKALCELAQDYAGRGLRLQRKRKRVQLVTAPETASHVRRFLGLELTGRLSPAALETLAIVAYRQPVTRGQIEGIRGVNSDSVMRTLVNRGLVEELGRLDQAGRPIIFGTTFEFLQQFGLTGLDQLPPLELDVEPANGEPGTSHENTES